MPPEVSELILQRLGEIQDENRVDHEMLRDNITEHGERITAVETSLSDLKPKVEHACRKANSVKVSVAELKGEKRGSGKVMRYLWPVALLIIGSGLTLFINYLRSL